MQAVKADYRGNLSTFQIFNSSCSLIMPSQNEMKLLSTFVYYWKLIIVCLFVFWVEEGFATGFHERES